MPNEFNHLNKEDLYLLMESYRNMIQMHSTLAEQQKTIIELQNEIMNKQEKLSSKQSTSCDQLEKISKELEGCSANLTKANDNIISSSGRIDKSISTEISTVKDKMGRQQVDLTKQHSSIINRLYISYGLMASIIIGLVTLIVSLIDKYNLLKDIHNLIHKTATYLNLIN